MIYFKRICTSVLVLIMVVLCFAGCHKKDETAVTVGKVKFTSAYYMCALINSDSKAKTKVKDDLSDDEKNKDDIDYYSKKIEDKKFVTWVEDDTIDSLKKIAAYKTLCEKADLSIDDNTVSQVESYANYYWSNYGYSQYYEPNGVNKDTYTQYMKDSYYSNLYFEHLYGEGGEKEISADDVKATTLENFILTDKIEVSFSGKSDDDKSAMKTQMNLYLTSLQNGSKTFDEVYKEYKGSDGQDETTSEESDSKDLKPLDKNASVIGAEDTSLAVSYFSKVMEMAVGDIKLIELDNDAGLVLVIKKELSEDPYYVKSVDLSARHLIKDDEYNKYIEDYIKDMDCKINSYATKQFKVKKIKEPKASSTPASTN